MAALASVAGAGLTEGCIRSQVTESGPPDRAFTQVLLQGP